MGLEWKQEPDGLGHVGFDVGLISILRAEALEQIAGVEIQGWDCHDLVYGWENGELIWRQ